jgi:hypothetical protein
MERNFYNDDFERLIRQKADQYKMYPSDQVWKGVYKSLHGRKRWRWAGLAVLLLGIGIYTADLYFSDKPANQIAKNIQPSITAATESNQQTAAIPVRENNVFTQSGAITGGQHNNTPVSRSAELPLVTDRTNTKHLVQDVSQPITSYSNEGSFVIENDPEDITAIKAARNSSVENNTEEINIAAPIEKNGLKEPAANAEAANQASTLADAASESVLPAEKRQSVNWLQDYAVFQLAAQKPDRLNLQLHFSPTVNYRKLRGSSYYPISDVKNIPLSSNIMGDVDQYVKHRPALGFEVGASLLYRASKRVNIKAGVQFNYSRYTIEAYEGHSEIATISLNTAFLADTVSRYSNIRNLSGFAQEDLANHYYQLSVPVGIDFTVLGDKNLQVHVAGTIQPTYLLNRNSYLITTDYKNYMREPSLVRRWNVNGGLETYVSYNTGTVRWQVGPQFRYQLLSTYSRKYPIREQLMEYGFKIGVSKTLK